MNRHATRELAMTCLYQTFLLNKDIKQSVYENNPTKNEVSPFLYTITIDNMKNKNKYINRINEVLKDGWTFDRLGYLEQAILMIAACELDFETASRNIVIDEAITLAKKYCDEDAYKLINGVLDRL